MKPVKQKIFIIHFLPLEQYPPAMNMIDYLSVQEGMDITVMSTRPVEGRKLQTYKPSLGQVKISRPVVQLRYSKWRYFNYLIFYSWCFIRLLMNRPHHIYYIETLSSWPALWYKKIFGRRVKLSAHYHEYTTPDEYENRMLLTKWMHRSEMNMYHQFGWISQTNPIRMGMFRNDIGLQGKVFDPLFQIMPNYPPPEWVQKAVRNKDFSNRIIRLVYVGSIGVKNMYVQELFEWVSKHKDRFTLDIYAHNVELKTKELLSNLSFDNIHYRGGCDYQQLPEILQQYDVGVVIYKPFSQNTIHAVSNKVFEYLSLGLDVWFSTDMTHTFEYENTSSFPKVLPVNFNRLDEFNFEAALNRDGIKYVPSPFHYESVYSKLAEYFLRN